MHVVDLSAKTRVKLPQITPRIQHGLGLCNRVSDSFHRTAFSEQQLRGGGGCFSQPLLSTTLPAASLRSSCPGASIPNPAPALAPASPNKPDRQGKGKGKGKAPRRKQVILFFGGRRNTSSLSPHAGASPVNVHMSALPLRDSMLLWSLSDCATPSMDCACFVP